MLALRYGLLNGVLSTGEMEKICAVTLLVLAIISPAFGADWSYDGSIGYGVDEWDQVNPVCGQNRQSPVDFSEGDLEYDSDLGAFSFSGYDSATLTNAPSPVNITVSNNGHTVVYTSNSATWNASMSGGGLPMTYNFVQMHLHWGEDATKGSEHVINGLSHTAELHLVHLRSDLATLSDGLQDPTGLAVLGIFLDVGSDAGNAYQALADAASQVPFKDDSASVEAFPLAPLLPADKSKYYRYDGSLTTPPCSEAVVWTVFIEPVKVTASQMEALRSLYEGTDTNSTTLVHNYRPAQDLNGRKLRSSIAVGGASVVTSQAASVITAAIFLLYIIF